MHPPRPIVIALLLPLALLLLSWPTFVAAAPLPQSTDTAVPSDTPVPTVTPTPLYDVDVVLPSGAHYQLERRITYGEIAVAGVGALLLLVLVPYVVIRVVRLWI